MYLLARDRSVGACKSSAFRMYSRTRNAIFSNFSISPRFFRRDNFRSDSDADSNTFIVALKGSKLSAGGSCVLLFGVVLVANVV